MVSFVLPSKSQRSYIKTWKFFIESKSYLPENLIQIIDPLNDGDPFFLPCQKFDIDHDAG